MCRNVGREFDEIINEVRERARERHEEDARRERERERVHQRQRERERNPNRSARPWSAAKARRQKSSNSAALEVMENTEVSRASKSSEYQFLTSREEYILSRVGPLLH
jgi:hypothetical protein